VYDVVVNKSHFGVSHLLMSFLQPIPIAHINAGPQKGIISKISL